MSPDAFSYQLKSGWNIRQFGPFEIEFRKDVNSGLFHQKDPTGSWGSWILVRRNSNYNFVTVMCLDQKLFQSMDVGKWN